MQRTLVSDDGKTRVYEVRDDEGEVIGSDVESITAPDPSPVSDLAAALATLPAEARTAALISLNDIDPGTLAAVRDEITATLGDGFAE